MASTIKVDNIQDQDGNNIINENANTITIGASGDTVTLASGASQSGFGRTGTVDWQTTIKTSTFTAVNGEGYFVNTTGGAVTVNLPAGSVGAIVSIKDYAQSFDTNNCTISADGSEKIENLTQDLVLNTEGIAVTLIYADATRGWQAVNSNEVTNTVKFVSASGGTITTSGDFKIHTFTGPGTFTVSCAGNAGGSNSVDYFVVAGGGGGGGASSAGGGGGGGFRLSNSTCMPSPQTSPLATPTALPVSAQDYPITVGGGGSGGPSSTPSVGANGSNSVFSSITSAGGGFGASYPGPGSAGPGGSGGGVGFTGTIGSGNTPPVSPPQGNNGGQGNNPAGGGGGGGAGATGGEGPNPPGQAGGAGGAGSFVVQTGFAGCNGTPGPVSGARYFTGGGAGRGGPALGSQPGGVGGGGTGGCGSTCQTAGTTNTGGGGGGAGSSQAGKAGGSGIVIIRYKFQ